MSKEYDEIKLILDTQEKVLKQMGKDLRAMPKEIAEQVVKKLVNQVAIIHNEEVKG